jgi:hypothetical protein
MSNPSFEQIIYDLNIIITCQNSLIIALLVKDDEKIEEYSTVLKELTDKFGIK